MNTSNTSNTLKSSNNNSKGPLNPTPKRHHMTVWKCIDSWGSNQRYYLAAALECLASAGTYRPKVETIHQALHWLKLALVHPEFKNDYDRTVQELNLDEDIELAFDYTLAAATADTTSDDIEAAIRCLENKLVFLNEIEQEPLMK